MSVIEQAHEDVHYQAAKITEKDPDNGPVYPSGKCWDEASGKTRSLSEHPGGEFEIWTFAGVDATVEFNMIHPPDVIGKCAPGSIIGMFDGGSGGSGRAIAASGGGGGCVGIPMEEVAKHDGKSDDWMVVAREVLDVTSFLSEQPGGELAILTSASKYATEEFNTIHPDIIGKYAPDAVIGKVSSDVATVAGPTPTAADGSFARKDKGSKLGSHQAGGHLDGDPRPNWRANIDNNSGALLSNVKFYFHDAWFLLRAMLYEVCSTILAEKNIKISNDRLGLSRSEVLLILFIVTRAVGNLHVFKGPDDFNGFGYFYVRLYWPGLGLPAGIAEEYILLSVLLHVLVGLKPTWDMKLAVVGSRGIDALNLAISGLMFLMTLAPESAMEIPQKHHGKAIHVCYVFAIPIAMVYISFLVYTLARFLVFAMLYEVCATIFSVQNIKISNDRRGPARSAILLIMFIVSHAVGNFHVFTGPDVFHVYGFFHVRSRGTGFCLPANVVKEFILLSVFLHGYVGLKRTRDMRLALMGRQSIDVRNLATSSLMSLTFRTIHLLQFRFGDADQFGLCSVDGAAIHPSLRSAPNNATGMRPKTLLNYDAVDADTKALVDARMRGDSSPEESYINQLSECIPEDVKAMGAAISETGNGKLFSANAPVDDPNEMFAHGKYYFSQFGPLLENCELLVDDYVAGGTAETCARRNFPQQFLEFIFLSVLLHGFVGLKRTWDMLAFVGRQGIDVMNLAISNLMALTFMTIHLFQIRFGDADQFGTYCIKPMPYPANLWGISSLNPFRTNGDGTQPVGVRDICALDFRFFTNPRWSFFYTFYVHVFMYHPESARPQPRAWISPLCGHLSERRGIPVWRHSCQQGWKHHQPSGEDPAGHTPPLPAELAKFRLLSLAARTPFSEFPKGCLTSPFDGSMVVLGVTKC